MARTYEFAEPTARPDGWIGKYTIRVAIGYDIRRDVLQLKAGDPAETPNSHGIGND